jgi:hypothetical protein
MTYAVLACRGLIALAFTVSVIAKVRGPSAYREFASWLAALPVPLARKRALAPVFVAAEAAIVILTAVPNVARIGLVLAACCLAAMSAGSVVIMTRDAHVSCWCFGPSRSPLGARHLVRNGILMLAAVAGATQASRGASSPAGIALSLAAALTGTTFLVFVDDLIALFGSDSPTPADELATGMREKAGRL